jgi:uncharacterized protein YndB with AHSA1/START domain
VADNGPIIKEILIDAAPEDIFPYLTQSEKYVLWMGRSAVIDARPGGIFEVDPNSRDVISGRFIEVIPPTRIVFTWGWKELGHPVPAGSTRVVIELIPQGSATLLRLAHYGVPDASGDRHRRGWSHYLGRLQSLMSGKAPGPDPYSDAAIRHG